ncbi:hypothetical protein B0H17DRAFT_1334264 [Mycena rosella]|uniref:F-box domain-containing protein n=1 Tax=Mycena rosella TaxID=1033263 RepID=A0AAD7D3N2_MYCRO|nr:hypothetical protein B0H17DRAFT_1334264 [Mycena rosella]
MMSTDPRVPAELLDEIVAHFSPDSDHATLKDLSLTSRRFDDLSRPLVFTSFNFYPYSVVTGSYGLCAGDFVLPPAPDLNRARERLEFWASARIAPYVLECNVEPLEFENSGRLPPPGEDPYMLLAAFFQFLPRFTRLRGFSGFHVHFTQITVANLCQIVFDRLFSFYSSLAYMYFIYVGFLRASELKKQESRTFTASV